MKRWLLTQYSALKLIYYNKNQQIQAKINYLDNFVNSKTVGPRQIFNIFRNEQPVSLGRLKKYSCLPLKKNLFRPFIRKVFLI